MQTVSSIPVEKINIDAVTASRASLNEGTIDDYAEAMRRGDQFPPIEVYFDETEKTYWLSDGAHRLAARQYNQEATIEVEVRTGTRTDAEWASFAANKTHGFRRTTADKRKTITAALKHAHGAGMSDNQLAKHCGVDPKTVAERRRELETTKEIPESPQRTGKDGRIYNTAKFAEANKARAEATRQEQTAGPVFTAKAQLKEQIISTAQDILKIGHALQDVRARLNDNYWKAWLEHESTMEAQTAERYIIIARTYREEAMTSVTAGQIVEEFYDIQPPAPGPETMQ